MRISLQQAFVLHHRPYRETSLIVELLTQEHGRISAIARGARAPRSRIKALLQPFVPILTSWQGKSELMTLGTVEPKGAPLQLRGECLLSALYLNELLIRVLHKQDPCPELYTIYYETLLELQTKKEGENGSWVLQKTLRLFEKKLLDELGYGLQLQYDMTDGKPFIAEKEYRYYPEQGFELYQEMPHAHFKESRDLVFSGKSLLALATENLDDTDSLRDAKRLMRLAMSPLLGSQPLQSRKLFIEVEKE